jgi:hypothetical protein
MHTTLIRRSARYPAQPPHHLADDKTVRVQQIPEIRLFRARVPRRRPRRPVVRQPLAGQQDWRPAAGPAGIGTRKHPSIFDVVSGGLLTPGGFDNVERPGLIPDGEHWPSDCGDRPDSALRLKDSKTVMADTSTR